MRSVRTVIISLITLAAATLAGPLLLVAPAGAQAQWTCAEGELPNYHPCLPAGEDKNCADLGFSVHVAGGDPYDLDRDGDGVGCDAEYGQPEAPTTVAVDPTAVPATPEATPEPTPTLSGLMPTVDGQCLTLEFDTAGLAPVTIVQPDGNVTSLTTDAGQWMVNDNNVLTFTPVVNAAYPAGVNLNGTTNGQTVVVTAIAECLTGRLAQVGTTAPTAAPSQTPVTDPTPPAPALAYTGAETTPLTMAGIALLLLGGVALVAANRIRS